LLQAILTTVKHKALLAILITVETLPSGHPYGCKNNAFWVLAIPKTVKTMPAGDPYSICSNNSISGQNPQFRQIFVL
jgi:hypothetical protein